jgi:hypothetical protein
MKDDPNYKMMTDRVIAGDITNMIMARLGWGANLF